MLKNNVTSRTLAAYAVLKALTDSEEYRSQYAILFEFIKYIIAQHKLRSFFLVDIQNYLSEDFGFTIPQAAIKTALKHAEGYKKQGEHYLTEVMPIENEHFNCLHANAERDNRRVIDSLFEYASTISTEIRQDYLEEAFVRYLIDDSYSPGKPYLEIISNFLIQNESNTEYRRQIEEIREGSILYCGLTYNMSEIGSITEELTLFLDTEILFNIAGYNGAIYQQLTEDLLTLVEMANKGQKKIKLRYFREVKDEIDSFFRSAEFTVTGKGDLVQRTAMRAIVNGCFSISEVRAKQADFYHNLQSAYGIVLDERDDYYSETNYIYNIESVPDGFERDEKSFEAVKYISHINVLRKGFQTEDYTKCRYLLVTQTRRVQEMANAIQRERECCHSLPTSVITNILWFKLGCWVNKKGYPANVDVIYKAKEIISTTLSNSISQAYEQIKEQYRKGEITEEQLSGRIVMFRERIQPPENITAENMEELLDISPEAIERFEQGIKSNQLKLAEKEEIIARLTDVDKERQKKEAKLQENLAQATIEKEKLVNELAVKNQDLVAKDRTIQDQNIELDRYRQDEINRKKRVERRKQNISFAAGILLVLVITAGAVCLVSSVLRKMLPEYYAAINLVIDVFGIAAAAWSIFSWLRKKVYGSSTSKDQTEE